MITRILMSQERRTDLRRDVAARRRALATNAGIYASRHAAALLDCVGAKLTPAARAALRDALATLGEGLGRTDAKARRLRLALAPLARASRVGGGDPDDPESVAWHVARIGELLAQADTLRHRETMLAMSSPHLPATRPERGRRARLRAALSDRIGGPAAPPARTPA